MKPYYHFCVNTHVKHKKFMREVNRQKTKVAEVSFEESVLWRAIRQEVEGSCEKCTREQEQVLVDAVETFPGGFKAS